MADVSNSISLFLGAYFLFKTSDAVLLLHAVSKFRFHLSPHVQKDFPSCWILFAIVLGKDWRWRCWLRVHQVESGGSGFKWDPLSCEDDNTDGQAQKILQWTSGQWQLNIHFKFHLFMFLFSCRVFQSHRSGSCSMEEGSTMMKPPSRSGLVHMSYFTLD